MKICIYGASSNSIDEEYLKAGMELGQEMAMRGHELVFGGGNTGLMGAVARGMRAGAETEAGAAAASSGASGAKILGIAPHFFNKPGVLYQHCTELIFTEDMRQRKERMEKEAEGFIMTPGGIGTYEEFFEILTLKQLGRHDKPIAILNTNGYYDEIAALLAKTAEKGFMKHACLDLYYISDAPKKLLNYLETGERE